MPVAAALVQEPRLAKLFAEFGQIDVAESFLGRERQFERGTFQVIHKNFEVVRLNVGVLGRTAEEIVRMLHDELVERRRRGNEDREGTPATPPCPSCALPG